MDQTFPRFEIELAKEADFDLGALSVRPSTRQLRWEEGSSTLEPRLMQVLVALARRPAEVVSRYDLLEACWGGRIVGQDALDRCISRLRKVGSTSGGFAIETIPRVGYRFTTAANEKGQRGEAPTLAVLPFVNRSGLPEDDIFADGMVEDIIDAMAQGMNGRVLASVVTAGLRQAAIQDFQLIGRRLGVRYILDGSVRRVEGSLRVSTRLVEAETGTVLHSGRFERPLAELASLQEDLVLEVAGCLDSEVYLLEVQRALKKPANLTAWEATRRALGALGNSSPESLMTAVREAERAVAIDPEYPAGLSVLAHCLAIFQFTVGPDDPAVVERVRSLALRARDMSADETMVLANVGGALTLVGLPDEGLPHILKALKRSPNFGPAHYSAVCAYCLLDRAEEAFPHMDATARLMPFPAMLTYVEAWRVTALMRLGRWDEAQAASMANFEMSPEHPTTLAQGAFFLWRAQRHEEANTLIAKALATGIPPEVLIGFWGRVFLRSGVREEFVGCLASLTERASQA